MHLVDNGVPLRVIKYLLGHNSVKTTEVYLNISKHYLKEVKSPFDGLNS
jgi:integrase/recombinase XerD